MFHLSFFSFFFFSNGLKWNLELNLKSLPSHTNVSIIRPRSHIRALCFLSSGLLLVHWLLKSRMWGLVLQSVATNAFFSLNLGLPLISSCFKRGLPPHHLQVLGLTGSTDCWGCFSKDLASLSYIRKHLEINFAVNQCYRNITELNWMYKPCFS